MKPAVLLSMLTLAATSACGTTLTDRALSGGAIGAGVGTVGGALLGMPVAGAILGGTAGAIAGAGTLPEHVNLGKPVWR